MLFSLPSRGCRRGTSHHCSHISVTMLTTRKNSPFWENCLRKNLPERNVRRSSRRFGLMKGRQDDKEEEVICSLSSSSSHVPSPSLRSSFLFLPSGMHPKSQPFSSVSSLSKKSAIPQMFLRSNAERRILSGQHLICALSNTAAVSMTTPLQRGSETARHLSSGVRTPGKSILPSSRLQERGTRGVGGDRLFSLASSSASSPSSSKRDLHSPKKLFISSTSTFPSLSHPPSLLSSTRTPSLSSCSSNLFFFSHPTSHLRHLPSRHDQLSSSSSSPAFLLSPEPLIYPLQSNSNNNFPLLFSTATSSSSSSASPSSPSSSPSSSSSSASPSSPSSSPSSSSSSSSSSTTSLGYPAHTPSCTACPVSRTSSSPSSLELLFSLLPYLWPSSRSHRLRVIGSVFCLTAAKVATIQAPLLLANLVDFFQASPSPALSSSPPSLTDAHDLAKSSSSIGSGIPDTDSSSSSSSSHSQESNENILHRGVSSTQPSSSPSTVDNSLRPPGKTGDFSAGDLLSSSSSSLSASSPTVPLAVVSGFPLAKIAASGRFLLRRGEGGLLSSFLLSFSTMRHFYISLKSSSQEKGRSLTWERLAYDIYSRESCMAG
ncbi:abc transporter family protein, partial [Cystoisospora suis]